MKKVLVVILLIVVCGTICAQPILYVESPSCIGRSRGDFKCFSVRLTSEKTIITHRYVPIMTVGWFGVKEECYLQTFDNPRKYRLLYTKNADYSREEAQTNSYSKDFVQVFEALPPNCTRFKYYEPDGTYDTYELINNGEKKIIYSNNNSNNNFRKVADAFSDLINNTPNVISLGLGNKNFSSKIKKIELAFNYPIITFLFRLDGNSTETACEFMFNVNNAKIKERETFTGKKFYFLYCESGIDYNNLENNNEHEDYILNCNGSYYLFLNSDYPDLNLKIGNALNAILKTARNPNAIVSIDFDKSTSDTYNNPITKPNIIGNKQDEKKNVTPQRSVNRVPTLKKKK